MTFWRSPDAQFEPKQPNQTHRRDGDRNPLVFENASHSPIGNDPVNRLNPHSASPAATEFTQTTLKIMVNTP
jgi:hypothetical protein